MHIAAIVAAVVTVLAASAYLAAALIESGRVSRAEDEEDLRRIVAKHGRVLVWEDDATDEDILRALGEAFAQERGSDAA